MRFTHLNHSKKYCHVSINDYFIQDRISMVQKKDYAWKMINKLPMRCCIFASVQVNTEQKEYSLLCIHSSCHLVCLFLLSLSQIYIVFYTEWCTCSIIIIDILLFRLSFSQILPFIRVLLFDKKYFLALVSCSLFLKLTREWAQLHSDATFLQRRHPIPFC
jgi:hypothetical protein